MSKRGHAETPRTEHRGYSIYYTDNSEIWRCQDLDLEAERLSQLKSKIDRELKKMREADGVSVLYLFDGHVTEALVIKVIVQTRLEHTREGSKDIRRVYLHWYGGRRGDRKTLQARQEIGDFLPDTPEVRDMLREAERQGAEIDALRAKREAFLDTIPRVTEAMFSTLPQATR